MFRRYEQPVLSYIRRWVRVEIHRMRAKLRDILRRHIAETVATPDQIEEEFTYLRTVLAKER